MSHYSHESSGPLSHGTRGPRSTAARAASPTASSCCDHGALRGSLRTTRSARAAASACAPPSARRRAATRRARRAPVRSTSPDRPAAAHRALRAAARSSAGASPLVEIASVTPSRRTTPLRNALALAGSSTALTNTRRVSATSATWRLTSGVAAATTSQTPSRSAGSKGRWAMVIVGWCLARDDNLVADVRRDHADARPGGQQLRQLGRSDRSAADEQDGSSGQIQEQRQQISHKKQKGPGSCGASRALGLRRCWARSRCDRRLARG